MADLEQLQAEKKKEKNRFCESVGLEIESMEYSIKMLRIKMQMTTNLSEKIRYYNEIKTLQENIDRLKIKAEWVAKVNGSPKHNDSAVCAIATKLQISEENKIAKCCWCFNLILGIILILVALWVFCNPEITYNSLATAFSLTLLFTGTLEIISSIKYKNLLNEWRLSVIIGILDLLVSIIVFSMPQISTEALTLVMAFVFLYRLVKLIAWSTELKNYVAISCGWVIFGSIIGVNLSYLLIWNQAPSLSIIIFLTIFALILIGISEIYFSNTLRKLNYKIA